jgi:uncharacterized protein
LLSDESKPFAANKSTSPCDATSETYRPRTLLRLLASFTTSFNFALALSLSNLTDPVRVVSFLLLPFDKAFDPSLCFVGLGAVPLSLLLYHFRSGGDSPRLGGQWNVPKNRQLDAKLIGGAAIFGIGWGISGICRVLTSFIPLVSSLIRLIAGPGLVNLGRALSNGSNVVSTVAWVSSVGIGGLLL